MSLEIDVHRVSAVLLSGGWLDVAWVKERRVSSFQLDFYEFVTEGAGSENPAMVSVYPSTRTTGFMFVDPAGKVVAGPLSAVLAVRMVDALDERLQAVQWISAYE